MSKCKNVCHLCRNFVATVGVSIATIDTVPTLILNLPDNIPCGYINGRKVCFAVTQNLPTEATILMPVSITLGTNATAYPLLDDCCNRITACGIRTRTRYSACVSTMNGGSFRLLGRVPCYPQNIVASLPTAPVAPATPAVANVAARSVASAPKKTSAKTVDNMTVQTNTVTVSKEEK